MTFRAFLIAVVLLLASPFIFSQDQRAPRTPEDAMQPRELIAWSSLQKPQPTPQPLPPPDTPIPQPGQKDQAPDVPADPQMQQTPSQTFVGMIESVRGKFVLKVGNDSTYDLTGVGDLRQFENRNVKVTGILDRGSNLIHVSKIDLA